MSIEIIKATNTAMEDLANIALNTNIFNLAKFNSVKNLPTSTSGLYFICDERNLKVLYIGKSVNIRNRFNMGAHNKHKMDDVLEFNANISIRILPLPKEMITILEIIFLRIIKPPNNQNLN